jgi:hypothetical protein
LGIIIIGVCKMVGNIFSALIIDKVNNNLNQRFSTWGTRTSRGMGGGYKGYAKSPQGYAKFKNLTQMKLIWVEFFIWGYAKGMGVCRGVQF